MRMISQQEWEKRRQSLFKKIGRSAVAIIPASPIAFRNGDYDYPYRPNSDFYYLTGFEEPEAVAIFAPGRKEGEFVLFNRARHPEREIWDGPRAGQAGAKKFGAQQAFVYESFAEKLPEFLMGRKEVHYLLGINPHVDEILLATINKLRGKVRKGASYPSALIDLSDTIHEMRLIKSPAEIKLMQKAADIAAQAHIRAMKACKPGVNEYSLEAEITYEFQRSGARYPAYTSIIGSGANTCILHYNANNQIIKNGSLVLIDAGDEYQYYASDITRTFPANGTFSPEQRAIYQIVLNAQKAAINHIKPGVTFDSVHAVAVKVLTQGLIKLGLLRGSLKKLIQNRAYVPFYMHSTSHWLGLDVHDAGRYTENNQWRKLKPGMVLTVEPGIYISAAMKKVPKRWHNIGVRIEDDVLVTKNGYKVLSAKAPKEVKDIEKIMSGDK
ncbi:MAG TPA: Xaa-Pro aminopeptidase [Gammaproteobacteria bacterium]|nr:Xaa-Pro aminopeptidase [Gammaproteobacteria bacterium]